MICEILYTKYFRDPSLVMGHVSSTTMMLLVSRKSKQGDVVIGKGGWFVMLVGEKLEDAKYFFSTILY